MIGRKQTTPNEDWICAYADIEKLFSKKALDALEAETLDAIRDTAKDKKVAFAWSGGKDSIVLADLCEKAGITDSMFAHTDLEYPAFLAWCDVSKPKDCTVINTGQDLDWLAKHPEMLFPQDARTNYRWFQIVQQAGILKYIRDNDLDMIAVGHRKADGNFVGKDNISRNSRGVTRYSPLADWSHEAILAYIHYHDLTLPPIYGWKNGFKAGTHPWAARPYTGSIENGWKEVYEIAPSVVIAAAEKIDSAAHFLEKGVRK